MKDIRCVCACVCMALVLSGCGGAGMGPGAASQERSIESTGTPVASLSPTSLSFGVVPINRASYKTVTLSNTGTAALTISSITTTTYFAQGNNCGTSLPAAAKCTITVTFFPRVYGSVSGTLKVYDNAVGSPQQVALFGSTGACTRAGGRCALGFYPPCCPGLRCIGFSAGNYCEPSTAQLPYSTTRAVANGVYVVNRVKNVVTATIPVDAGALALAILPDGSKIYVANARAHEVSVIATRTNAVVKTLQLPSQERPTDVTVSRDGLFAYAADPQAGVVSMIDTQRDAIESTIPDGIVPAALAVLPRCSQGVVGSADGSIAYALNGQTDRHVARYEFQ